MPLFPHGTVGFEVAGLVGQAGELEHVGVADKVGDLAGGIGGLLAGCFDDGVFVGGEAGAFVEEGADLALELAFGLVALETLILIESTLPRVFEGEQVDEMRP